MDAPAARAMTLRLAMASERWGSTALKSDFGMHGLGIEVRPGGRLTACCTLLLANVIFGTTFVATKPMFDRVPPMTIAAGRFAIVLLVLIPLLLRSGRRPNLSRTAAVMGGVGVFLTFVTQNLGLEMTSATNAALIQGGVPVMTMLIAGPVLAERLDASRLTGGVISIVGIAVIVLFSQRAAMSVSLAGDGLILISAVAFSVYLIIGRRAFAGADSLEVVAGVSCYGLLLLAPASGIEIVTRGIERPTGGDMACWLYLGIVASAVGLLLEGIGLRHLEAGQASLFANLGPLVGLLAAALMLGESISMAQIGGGLLILGGVWLATRRSSIDVESDPEGVYPAATPGRAIVPDVAPDPALLPAFTMSDSPAGACGLALANDDQAPSFEYSGFDRRMLY